jgi:hypothetical protein
VHFGPEFRWTMTASAVPSWAIAGRLRCESTAKEQQG